MFRIRKYVDYIDEVLYFPMFISEEIQEFVYKKKKNEENGSIFQIFFRAFKSFHLSFKLKPDRKKVGCV